MTKKKKAVLAYSFSANNAGDFALTIAAIDILIKNHFEVLVISRFRKTDKEYNDTESYYQRHYKDRVKMIESPFILDRDASVLRKLRNNIHGFLVLSGIIKKNIIHNVIADCDIVIMGPGNLLRCSSFADFMRLKALYYPLGIGKSLNKEFVILPQSTAEIKNYAKPLLGKFLDGAKVAFIRENLSYNKLKKTFPGANLEEAIDLAFFLLNEKLFVSNNKTTKKIAFTLRIDGIGGLRKFTVKEMNSIKERVFNTINSLGNNYEYSFIVQAPHRDKRFAQECQSYFLEKFGFEIPIIEEHDPLKLIKLYAGYDLLIGMRLHSIILAACGGTPSYGLFFKEWGLKNPGILNSLELPFTMIDDNQDIEIAKIHELLSYKEEFQKKVLNIYERDSKKFQYYFSEIL